MQNLKDTGCTPKTIEEICRLHGNGQVQDAVKVLRIHRCSLLESLHENQKKIDCLDFLVWCMEKNGRECPSNSK